MGTTTTPLYFYLGLAIFFSVISIIVFFRWKQFGKESDTADKFGINLLSSLRNSMSFLLLMVPLLLLFIWLFSFSQSFDKLEFEVLFVFVLFTFLGIFSKILLDKGN